ncbi:hypothetical protein IO99_13870 [Clostridium sulfidigenes]|uniref:DNA-binding protein n=2 Tax=Clostridium sulfidigenes TaxID=318464 RepID=A0A084J9E2_9CLOT|nr:hypothetical protein IO99_13870 [Clostridium sulfidigenes]
MARKEITISKISELLDINRDTASRKLSGKSPIYLDEAMLINKTFFPDENLPYLFIELMPNQNKDFGGGV